MFTYLLFAIVVTLMLLLDLGMFNKKAHAPSNKEAIGFSLLWIALSMLFSGYIYWQFGHERFIQFQSCYWIEKSLSVDNLFVFLLIFNYFHIPQKYQHKVLFWGIIGALVLRAIFIFSGVWLIESTYLNFIIADRAIHLSPILLFFGLFLIWTGIKSVMFGDDKNEDFSSSRGAKIVRGFCKMMKIPLSKEFDGAKFFTIENGIKVATPLLIVVGVIEVTDLLFAVDSIPAIFAIAPGDSFILYSSNIFAILGLRAMYFVLRNYMNYFSKLKYGLAFILSFIGVKMVVNPIYHLPTSIALGTVLVVLIGCTIWSIVTKPKNVTVEQEI